MAHYRTNTQERYRDSLANKRAFVVDTIHRYCWQKFPANIKLASDSAAKALKLLNNGCYVDTAIDTVLADLDDNKGRK